jgi:hypothetical protein
MKTFFVRILLVILLMSLVYTPEIKAGHPCCYVLICCRSNNKGMTFLVNGQWLQAHDYKDINQVADILQKISDAGIKTIIVDMSNDSQWTNLWDEFKPMLENIQQVCRKKNMQFLFLIGAAGKFSFWNEKAERIWKLWSQDPTYRRYGFGDDRPMLVVFQPSDMYWSRYDEAPDSVKTYLSRFHIGTTQVNDPILPGVSDGWGYRNYSQSVDGKVRFACPNGGVHPDDPWYRISEAEWKRRVEWASQAEHYSVYGSYDDTCDGIHWGIADTKNTDVTRNKYPGDKPYLYYDVLKNILTGTVRQSHK